MKRIIILLSLVLMSCDQGNIKALTNNEGKFDCKATVSATNVVPKTKFKNAYERSGNKVVFNNYKTASVLPKDFKLSVLLDRECIANVSGLSFLTKDFKKLPKKDFKKFSKVEAYTVKLPAEISKADLEKIAKGDRCVKGVTEETFIEPQSLPNDPLFGLQSYMPSI
ncbi:MAG: hypothetical protein KDD37_08490 [Bdellovibrionales bacterium]|nr:hypothetical protein [Bdellovibrionales bacterium]